MVTLTNDGAGSLSVTSASIAGPTANDTASFSQANTCTTPLAPSGTCTFSVVFDPVNQGARTATLSIVTNGGTETVTLTGTGVNNTVATGAPAIDDTTPTEGVAINATLGNVADVNGVPPVVSFQWRQSNTPGGAVNIPIAAPEGTNPTFIPTQAQANRRLTVTVTFVDAAGYGRGEDICDHHGGRRCVRRCR